MARGFHAPDEYDNPEVSGTGLIAYAMAYGINQGLLDRATYVPVVVVAWNGSGRADSVR